MRASAHRNLHSHRNHNPQRTQSSTRSSDITRPSSQCSRPLQIYFSSRSSPKSHRGISRRTTLSATMVAVIGPRRHDVDRNPAPHTALCAEWLSGPVSDAHPNTAPMAMATHMRALADPDSRTTSPFRCFRWIFVRAIMCAYHVLRMCSTATARPRARMAVYGSLTERVRCVCLLTLPEWQCVATMRLMSMCLCWALVTGAFSVVWGREHRDV